MMVWGFWWDIWARPTARGQEATTGKLESSQLALCHQGIPAKEKESAGERPQFVCIFRFSPLAEVT